MEIDISYLEKLDPESLALTLDFIMRRTDLRTKTKQEKITYVCGLEKISISILQRVFDIHFPDAQIIIERLKNLKVIEPLENGYRILNHTSLKKYLEITF